MANSEWAWERGCSEGFFEVHVSNNQKRFGKKSSESIRKVLGRCKRQEIPILGAQSIKHRFMDERSI